MESLWACLQLWVFPLLSLAPQPWAPVATVEIIKLSYTKSQLGADK
jgi:hypothetical protein